MLLASGIVNLNWGFLALPDVNVPRTTTHGSFKLVVGLVGLKTVTDPSQSLTPEISVRVPSHLLLYAEAHRIWRATLCKVHGAERLE